MIGQTIGNYRIESQTGRGGMGVVYKAVDTQLDRPVAIKMLSSELAADPSLIERFRSEAKAQATLNHPNIAGLYTLLQNGEHYFMVMEFIPGTTVADLIDQTGPIPYQKAIAWLKQALLGISVAHRRGIIHRDIKPNNLMVADDGVVKVLDFGIARAVGGRRLTGTGILVGTLPYMSPEQVEGKEPDIRSDVYALGVTLYEMVTGRLPFDSQSDFHLMKEIVETPPPPPREFYPYIPEALQAVILKALAKEPGARYQSVEEFGAALEAVERQVIDLSVTRVPDHTALPGTASAQSLLPTGHKQRTTDNGQRTTPVSWWQRLRQTPQLLIGGGVAVLLLIGVLAYLWPDPIAPAAVVAHQVQEGGAANGSSSGQGAPGKGLVIPPDADRPMTNGGTAPIIDVPHAATSTQPAVRGSSGKKRESQKQARASTRSQGKQRNKKKEENSGNSFDRAANNVNKIGDGINKASNGIKSVVSIFKRR